MGVRVRRVFFPVTAFVFAAGFGIADAQTLTFQGLSGPSLASQATVQSVTDDTTSDAATFSGGALFTAETWLPANQSTVYSDSYLLRPATSNAITISFAQAVSSFSVDIYNGQMTSDTFVISNGLGNSVTETIAANNLDGTALVSIPQGGTTFTITDLDTSGYDFSIDNISYDLAATPPGMTGGGGDPGPIGTGGGAVPEPALWALMLVGTSASGAALRRRRRAGVEPAV
jgi:hypothetical protein